MRLTTIGLEQFCVKNPKVNICNSSSTFTARPMSAKMLCSWS